MSTVHSVTHAHNPGPGIKLHYWMLLACRETEVLKTKQFISTEDECPLVFLAEARPGIDFVSGEY